MLKSNLIKFSDVERLSSQQVGMFLLLTPVESKLCGGPFPPTQNVVINLQTVDHCASLSPVVLLLPLVHLSDELEEGALGHGRVSVHGPAQELELLHHPVAVLGL